MSNFQLVSNLNHLFQDIIQFLSSQSSDKLNINILHQHFFNLKLNSISIILNRNNLIKSNLISLISLIHLIMYSNKFYLQTKYLHHLFLFLAHFIIYGNYKHKYYNY